MSQSVVDVLDEKSVVALLQPGPKGTVRLSYEAPDPHMVRNFLEGLVPPTQMRQTYVAPSVIEIDRAKLLQL